MAVPSAIRLPRGETFRLVKADDGMYSVANAYEGNYEYFEDRPTDRNPFSAGEGCPIALKSAHVAKVGE